ncbi:DUF2255 family protein [Streptomyces sp. NPDC048430]|uniref:DUF2255 family protein n=1 Tax=unclassified Streptomyces TaxID=2593676 RepID=UPI00342CC7B3
MTWPAGELRRIARCRLLHVNPQRANGTPTRFVPVGFVAVQGDLYVRSMSASGLWYRRAMANGIGRIQARGIVRAATFRSLVYDVTFHDAADAPHDAIDAAFAKKYRLAGRRAVEMATNEASHPLTVRIVPR